MYTTTITIPSSQLDTHNCWRLSAILAAFQDGATTDSAALSLSRDDLLQKGAFWIVNRTSVWVREPVGMGELRFTTWHAACRGASWTRNYVLRRGETPVIMGTSIWAAVSVAEPRRLVRLDPVPAFTGDAEVPAPPHIRMGELAQAGERVIRYSDLDQNAHLNNARAVDLALDALDFGAGERRFVREAHIHYGGESKLGDALACFVGKTGDYDCFEARLGEKSAFDAAFRFDTF